MSQAVTGPEVLQLDPAEARQQIIDQTAELLGKATSLAHSIGDDFPFTRLVPNELARGTGQPPLRMLDTPRIVLPAEPLRSFGQPDRPLIRQSATILTFYYDYPYDGLQAFGLMSMKDLPVPNEVSIWHPKPLATVQDIIEYPKELHVHSDDMTISGDKVRMLGWSAHILGKTLPERHTTGMGEDELRNYKVFCDYPAEALRQQPEAVAFHQRRVEEFKIALDLVASAVTDLTLNPRRISA